MQTIVPICEYEYGVTSVTRLSTIRPRSQVEKLFQDTWEIYELMKAFCLAEQQDQLCQIES